MVKQSSHTRWKGCCLMCSLPGGWGSYGNCVHKQAGDAARTPFRELRKIGVKRRYSRNKAYGED